MSLARTLPGTWRLESRVDVTASGERRIDPSLGEDPIALLIYDRAGNFAAQFMKRDRSSPPVDLPAAGANNTRAQGGYDAYFGTYVVDDATGTVTQTIAGALTNANVGQVLSRVMTVTGDRLEIQVATTTAQGEPVTRTLTWTRIDREGARFIRHVGVVIAEQRPGFSECTLETGRQHDNSAGVVHGGALFTLADTGMGAALIPELEAGERCATIEVKINYLKPVKAGTVVCRTELLHRGRTIAYLDSSLYVDGQLVAKANGSYAIIRPVE